MKTVTIGIWFHKNGFLLIFAIFLDYLGINSRYLHNLVSGDGDMV